MFKSGQNKSICGRSAQRALITPVSVEFRRLPHVLHTVDDSSYFADTFADTFP